MGQVDYKESVATCEVDVLFRLVCRATDAEGDAPDQMAIYVDGGVFRIATVVPTFATGNFLVIPVLSTGPEP
jgi:hypothetical protein